MRGGFILVLHKNAGFIKHIKYYIPNAFEIIEKQKIESVLQEIRVTPISCIIIHIEQDTFENTHFDQFKEKFSHIPCIAVIASPNIELARYCGSIGIDCVLLFEKIHCIKEEIAKLCDKKENRISLRDLSIDKEDPSYSVMIKDSLSIMEKDYSKIHNVNEIANSLEINECTLTREFNKFKLPSPKRLLMYLKVNQAIKLMKSKGLNIREISSLSGFTDEKRMSECFHKMFGMPPGEYRIKNVTPIF